MHTVALLAHALNLAERLGYTVRQEWLDGNGGGGCELRGRKFLFIDLAISPADQLEIVVRVLRSEPRTADFAMPPQLREMLKVRKTA
jgi:hypothetical protein